MSLSDLLVDYPKPWANLYINSINNPATLLYPTITVPARLISIAGSLNNVQKTTDAKIVRIGNNTMIFTKRITLTNAEMNATGRLTFEIDYPFPAITDAVLSTWDQDTQQANTSILPVEMTSLAPVNGVTTFRSIRTDITRNPAVTAVKQIGSCPILAPLN